MMRAHRDDHYGAIARGLHWTMAALIVAQVAAGFVLETLPRRTELRSFAFDAHESVGIVLLVAVLVRLAWRLSHPAPSDDGPRWQRLAAGAAHAGLYALMIAVPVMGYAMVDAKGYDVAFFGATAPDLLATDKALADLLNAWHGVLAIVLAALVGVHVCAALWHRFVLRDDVFARMLPPAAAG